MPNLDVFFPDPYFLLVGVEFATKHFPGQLMSMNHLMLMDS